MDDRKLQMDSGDAATSEALQEASVSAPPLVAASQQDAPAPVEGKRNYGYPDEFMMYRFKVELCTRTDKHPRGSCPFAHVGDVAHRRHPSRYQALLCPEVRAKKACPRMDECQCSHSAFEFWLHPDRYRTSMCEKGAACTRPVCFFAHSQEELRPLPQGLKPAEPEPGGSSSSSKRRTSTARSQQVPTAMMGAGPSGFHHYLPPGVQHPQQQQRLLMQPGVQLMPVGPAAGGVPSGFAPVGYVPVLQPGAEGGMQYGQPAGGMMVLPPGQQQYVLQPGLQQLPQLPQQQPFEQHFLVSSQPSLRSMEGGFVGQWQQPLQQQQQQQVMMVMPGVGGPQAQPMQYPQQQVTYLPAAAADPTPWGAMPSSVLQQQQQPQQLQGPFAPAGGIMGSYVQYGTSAPASHGAAGGPGFSILAGSPAALQAAGQPVSGVLAAPPGVVPGDASFASDVAQLMGQPQQRQGPNW